MKAAALARTFLALACLAIIVLHTKAQEREPLPADAAETDEASLREFTFRTVRPVQARDFQAPRVPAPNLTVEFGLAVGRKTARSQPRFADRPVLATATTLVLATLSWWSGAAAFLPGSDLGAAWRLVGAGHVPPALAVGEAVRGLLVAALGLALLGGGLVRGRSGA